MFANATHAYQKEYKDDQPNAIAARATSALNKSIDALLNRGNDQNPPHNENDFYMYSITVYAPKKYAPEERSQQADPIAQ